ncbi:MAG: periplasmic protease [Halothiobacillaceae bacterium]|nr:MAG: periplasmic protease [Halothiobacillaceae bacterium]
MEEFLHHYGLFFAQTITILLVIGGLVILIASLSSGDEETEKLEIKKLNQPKTSGSDLSSAEKRVFVLTFNGDIKASAATALAEEITAILTVAQPTDEVVVRLYSAGGLVHAYGLAASQLQRIRKRNIPLTVAVDKVAASGGYMMACVADKIIAAPFAILGSIGVVAQIPNLHRLLKKHDIDFELITAGKYKRTLTVFGENTAEGREKFRQEIDETHKLFQEFITTHRPQVELERVATGEHWYGTQAIDFKLVDELITSDDYLMSASETHSVYEVHYTTKKTLAQRFGLFANETIDRIKSGWQQRSRENQLNNL